MDQMSFSDAEYSGKRKQTRREVFLAEMDQVVPWVALLERPHRWRFSARWAIRLVQMFPCPAIPVPG